MPPKERYDPRKAAAQGTKKYTHYDKNKVARSVKASQMKKAEGDDFLLVPQAYAILFTQEQVIQHGSGRVGTTGMSPCVGFAFFTTSFSHGVVGHFDSDNFDRPEHSAQAALRIILDFFVTSYVRCVDRQNYIAYIIAGPSGQPGLVDLLRQTAWEFSARTSVSVADSGDFVFSLPGPGYSTNVVTTRTPDQAFEKCRNCCDMVIHLRNPFDLATAYIPP